MKKSALNEVTLTFPSRSSNEGFARSAAACFAAQMDPTLNELEDIKTAVSEAVTNAIVHGYPDAIGTVTLKLRVCPGNILELTVKDKGRGIPDVEKARQPMFTTGICEMVKYFCSTSKEAVVPARRAEAIAAAGLCTKALFPA